MANYCGNMLAISSNNNSLIDELVEIANPPKIGFFAGLLGLKPRHDCNLLGFFRPMPAELKKTITSCISGPNPPWWHWMVDNWGCAYDPAVESTDRKNDNEVEFRFYSRYSPPLEAIEYGAQLHKFDYRLVYCETGNQFAGIATNTSHKEFEYSFEMHPREEGVPQEIIDEFDLEPIYQELKADPG